MIIDRDGNTTRSLYISEQSLTAYTVNDLRYFLCSI